MMKKVDHSQKTAPVVKANLSGESPMVSVIMTVFNAAPYLRDAVESILRQTYTEFEFIIIDDGSTDDSGRILATFGDPRIRMVSRENKGLAKSLNEAIGMARGRYIARMDNDDIALPHRLERQIAYMARHPEVGILGAQAYLIDEDGRHIGVTRQPVDPRAIARCLELICPVIHPTYFVRREVYHQVGGYRDLRIEDYDLLLRAAEQGVTIRNLPERLILYRTVSSGMSLSNLQRTISLWTLVRRAHQMRLRGLDDSRLFRRMRTIDVGKSPWFEAVSGLRHRLSATKARSRWPIRILFVAAIALVSLMHVQLLSFAFNYWRSNMITRRFG